MLVPRILYGKYADILKAVRKATREIMKGANLTEALTKEGFVDSSSAPGLCTLHGPFPNLGGSPHYQVWVPWALLTKHDYEGKVSPERMDQLFEQSLETPWGTLGILAFRNQNWADVPVRYLPILTAALRYWDEFATQGEWFTFGTGYGSGLWQVPSNVQFVLARLGVPKEVLTTPILPDNSLAALVATYLQNVVVPKT
jgi:hypothetical protein